MFRSYIGACAGLANTHKYWLLVVLRIIQAAGSSSVIAIGAGSIGDIAPPAERGLFMSIFGLGYAPLLYPGLLSKAELCLQFVDGLSCRISILRCADRWSGESWYRSQPRTRGCSACSL